MKQILNDPKHQETILYLLGNYSKEVKGSFEMVDKLQTLIFLISMKEHKIKEDVNYIGTREFHENIGVINAIKVQLISAITNIH